MATEEKQEKPLEKKSPEDEELEQEWLEILEQADLDEHELAQLIQRAAAAGNSADLVVHSDHGPQTDEELWQWFKDRIGVELPRVAVCPGHTSPFKIVCDIHFFRILRLLLIANRGGGKTSLIAWLDICSAETRPGFGSWTTGPGLSQGERKYEHMLPYVVEGGVIGGKELPHVAASTSTRTIWKNGSKCGIGPGTVAANNGPREPRLQRDELELMKEDVIKQAGNIPAGRMTPDGRFIPAQIIDSSTMKWAHGRVARLKEEHDKAIQEGKRPRMAVRIFCIYEIAEEQPACRAAPKEEREARLRELDRNPCELCDCDTYQSDYWDVDDDGNQRERTLEDVCAGRLFRSRGFKSMEDIKTAFQENDRETWEAEIECSQPSKEGVYIKGYSQNRCGVRDYEPDPDYGKIYMAVDWGGCYDAETEVLTSRGWVQWPEVTDEDEFASLDLETEEVEFQRAQSIVAQPHDGDMHRYSNRSVDLLVTDNHHMLVAPLGDRHAPMSRVRSSEVVNCSRVTKTSRGRKDAFEQPFVLPGVTKANGQSLPDVEIDAEDWAAFLGLWMAEGHTYLGKGKDGETRRRHGSVGITHFDDENLDEIEEIMGRYFKVYRGRQLLIHDPRLFDHLAPFGKAGDKRLPDYVKRWSPDLLRIYLDWHVRGDGCVDDDDERIHSTRIYTGSKLLADDLQEIAMYAGWAANITVRPPRDAVIEGHIARARLNQYAVSIIKTRTRPRIHHKPHEEPVKTVVPAEEWGGKMVYCAELPKHHTLYVRRNGKAVWCGNTDQHAVIWFQLTERELVVPPFIGDKPKVIPKDSIVVFAEIFRAGIGNVDLGNMVIAMEEQWRLKWPGWRVHERYPDYQNAAGRKDWQNHCDLKLTSRIKKDPPEEIKYIRGWVAKGRWFVDIGSAPIFDKAIRAWREENGHEARGPETKWSTHPLAAARYGIHNIEVIRQKDALKNRASGSAANPHEQVLETEEAPVSRRPEDRRLRTEVYGVAGAEDSPNRAGAGRLNGL